MMKKPVFTGVCTALVTPFFGEKVNLPMMRMLLARQEEAGIPAVVLFGTTGESPTLTDDEKHAITVTAKEHTDMTVIAGTGSNSTKHAVELSIRAEKDGADALLVVSPYYNKATKDGLIAHYKAIADAVSIPIILYNVPSRTGVDIPVSVYAELSKLPNIVGVKETTGNLRKLTEIALKCPKDFYVWCGADELTTPYIAMGAKGSVSVLSNVAPEDTTDMVDAALDGDFDTAFSLQCATSPLVDYLFCEVNPIPVKALLREMGYDCGGCRLPLCELSKAGRDTLNQLFP